MLDNGTMLDLLLGHRLGEFGLGQVSGTQVENHYYTASQSAVHNVATHILKH